MTSRGKTEVLATNLGVIKSNSQGEAQTTSLLPTPTDKMNLKSDT